MLGYSGRRRNARPWRRSCKITIVVPILFTVTILLALVLMMGESAVPFYFRYTTVEGYFMQSDPSTDPANFDYSKSNLGLIDRAYDTDKDLTEEKTLWQRFEHKVRSLNHGAKNGVQYKVLYMGRHGEGDHNVAQAFYGTEAWDCYWSLLDGNESVTWADAHLTEKGIEQIKVADHFWTTVAPAAAVPVPEKYYVSPLDRCLSTAQISFLNINQQRNQRFSPEVKEMLREVIGVHTCDRRSGKSYIEQHYPDYIFEKDFAEDDPLWEAELRESDSMQTVRLKGLLDDIFEHDPTTFISFTSHSGAIAAILRAIGHRPFALPTGSVIAVLVKAERILGEPPAVTVDPPVKAPTCTVVPTPSAAH